MKKRFIMPKSGRVSCFGLLQNGNLIHSQKFKGKLEVAVAHAIDNNKLSGVFDLVIIKGSGSGVIHVETRKLGVAK